MITITGIITHILTNNMKRIDIVSECMFKYALILARLTLIGRSPVM